jgi:hypothetical protein
MSIIGFGATVSVVLPFLKLFYKSGNLEIIEIID